MTTKPTTKATPTRTRARKPKTTTATAVPVLFTRQVLAYLQIAVEGPTAPGGTAHRIARYTVTVLDDHGRPHKDELTSGACLPTATRPIPRRDDDQADDGTTQGETQTVPLILCRSHSAAFAQANGVTRCTQPECWPIQVGETQGSQR
jgi:hypothetical protein